MPLVDIEEEANQFILNIKIGVYAIDHSGNSEIPYYPKEEHSDSAAYGEFVESDAFKQLMAR